MRVAIRSVKQILRLETRRHYSQNVKKPIVIRSIDEALLNFHILKSQIENQGYAFLNLPPTEESLLALSKIFGHIQRSKNSSSNGITSVLDGEKTDSEHGVISSLEFLPHTDGAYLKGITEIDGKFYKITPPRFVILQCVQPSTSGGTSILIDGNELLRSMLETYPEYFATLFRNDCMSMIHDEVSAVDVPVFSLRKSGSYTIRYSYDHELLIPDHAMEALRCFNNLPFHPALKQNLASGDVLIIDNTRMLHARTAFSGNRIFKRVWITDEEEILTRAKLAEEKQFYNSHLKRESNLRFFRAYTSISDRFKKEPKHLGVRTGIYLSPDIESNIKNILIRSGYKQAHALA